MKWNAKDIDIYLKEKKYVDTVVVPLLPIAFEEEMKHTANQGEFIELLALHLERQFKGRMLFLPAFSYLQDVGFEITKVNLSALEKKLLENGFSYVFYLTSDGLWNGHQDEFDGSVIWLPSIPLEHMDEPYKHSIMEDQVNQLLKIIVQKWK
ncbi:YpiF family protein [Falsibacillus albus]|uniref:DUF2487 family protein n=1 Tax=Falsibacillus albus TaxID=2478915 RepID=A0A3L7JYB9_9BACI|nr:YpiF family protein [Falsibacillus albus]RLQ95109.1 DUF2487 family protein [Falsibacillus albus]